MWLVLCSAQDWSALWAYEGLRRRGLAPLEVITPEALVYAPLIEHRISHGQAGARIRLQDGRVIEGVAVRGVLNRLSAVPAGHLQSAQPGDREYAAQELQAIFLSVLYSLGAAVINRPTPQGLAGAWRHPSEWALLAGRAGLPALPYRQDHRGTAAMPAGQRHKWVLLDGVAFGQELELPGELAEGCAGLTQVSATRLLEIEFALTVDGWRFASAQPMPDLCAGGEPLLDALAGALRA